MAKIRFEGFTGKEFEHIRRELNQAIADSSVAHVVSYAWNHRTLTIAAPGAHGSVWLEGQILRAEIRMSFPATLMKRQIIQDIQRILKQASGGSIITLE